LSPKGRVEQAFQACVKGDYWDSGFSPWDKAPGFSPSSRSHGEKKRFRKAPVILRKRSRTRSDRLPTKDPCILLATHPLPTDVRSGRARLQSCRSVGFWVEQRLSAADKPHSRQPEKKRPESRKRRNYLLCTPAATSGDSSAFRHPESGLYNFIPLASPAVFFPRSFSYTVPSSPTMNVITPDDRYSAG
jgi:hypothetical protein